MKHKAKIIIDPACDFYYSSFYIRGLLSIENCIVSFSSQPFKKLKYGLSTHLLAIVFRNESIHKRIVIDFADFRDINNEFLEWCDVYGKVNLHFGFNQEKVIPFAPNYACKVWDRSKTLLIGILNYVKAYPRRVQIYSFLARYNMTLKRNIFSVNCSTANPDNIFFLSTFWYNQTLTNDHRASFIRNCRQLNGITFRGGLINDNNDNVKGYEDVITEEKVDYEKYICFVRNSLLAFNTPAYHLCHGWKLPEYLFLGKAIISTPISNQLPFPLEHKKNIYIVDGSDSSIQNAIVRLVEDTELRNSLEKGAKDYYDRYIEPGMAFSRLIKYFAG